MAEYTYKDVIIDPEDPRVEIGKEYFFGDCPSSLLFGVQMESVEAVALEKVDSCIASEYPFDDGAAKYQCIIRKKEESNKKYVPFDSSKEEDRNLLKGAWIRKKDNSEIKLIWWFWEIDGKWMIDEDISPQELLDNWVFDFESLPCGKLVEE